MIHSIKIKNQVTDLSSNQTLLNSIKGSPMAYRLRALAGFAKDFILVPSIHMVPHKHLYFQFERI